MFFIVKNDVKNDSDSLDFGLVRFRNQLEKVTKKARIFLEAHQYPGVGVLLDQVHGRHHHSPNVESNDLFGLRVTCVTIEANQHSEIQTL
jgi:hypothetical protein